MLVWKYRLIKGYIESYDKYVDKASSTPERAKAYRVTRPSGHSKRLFAVRPIGGFSRAKSVIVEGFHEYV